jgi:hypothetical protein
VARLLALILLLGCRSGAITQSEDVSSRDMHVAVAVNGEAGRTVVRALPNYLGGLTLTGGDRLVLRGEQTMQREESGYYVATSPREGGTFIVDFLRANDRSITDLEVTVPPPFTLSASRTTAKWSDTVELTWDRAAGDFVTHLSWEGACAKKVVRVLASDAGSYTINVAEIASPSAPCTVAIKINRVAPWKSNARVYTTADQSRVVHLVIEP